MYDQILVALDGSEPSRYAGRAAVAIATATKARIIACHVYGAQIHRSRFSDMEPGLPDKYQQTQSLTDLRSAHNRLMDEGFQALSSGYVEEFAETCRNSAITVECVATEGRSYVGILQLAEAHRCDLIALGADGLGTVGDGMLGGTTTRILQNAPCDVLIARRLPDAGPILAGVDGSDEALKAVAKAVMLAQAMDKTVHLTAAYDPDFHTNVFSAMTQTLSPEDQKKAGLAGQKELHDDIINDGLDKLYADFLYEAQHRYNNGCSDIETFLLTGKPYCALDSQAHSSSTDLIVISRHGHHRKFCSLLGSNAEGLIRTTSTNVLLVGGVEKTKNTKHANITTECIAPASELTWDSDAESRLQSVPFFVRSVARRAVENNARREGKNSVSAEDFDNLAARFGMGPRVQSKTI